MRSSHIIFRISAIAALLQVATTPEAAAYIDPGSGSFFVQMLLAGLLGAGMAIKTYWHRIKGLFTGSKPTPPAEEEPRDS